MGDDLLPIDLPEGWVLHSLSAGYHHTCAQVDQVDEVGGVVCWGANLKGQVCNVCFFGRGGLEWCQGCVLSCVLFLFHLWFVACLSSVRFTVQGRVLKNRGICR